MQHFEIPISEKDHGILMQALLDFGEAMLACGAEVHRVEDTLARISSAYRLPEANVFVITSNITLTLLFEDGQSATQTRRIRDAGSTDFLRLERLNALSRTVCQAPIAPSELRRRVHALRACTVSVAAGLSGSFLAAGSFALFFGGSFLDGLLAGLVGLIIFLLKRHLAPFCMNTLVFNLLTSLLAGLCICICCKLLPALHLDKIMIGDIMLLIPGVGLTNAVRDILLGDTISGSMRLMETLLWAGALACGFLISLWLTGGSLS